jgi:hypothetical protein
MERRASRRVRSAVKRSRAEVRRLPACFRVLRLRGVQDFGKLLFIIGFVLIVIGAVLWKTGGLGGLGRLPGDIAIHKENSSFYFPIVTCILISLVLTLLAWLFRR